jgi:prepilin-type N-terminal cleavage/methylation domain-containing protein
MRRGGSQRGVTLIEVMLSMAVVLVGMMALFRVLSVASKGSQQSQRNTQGLARAQQIIEAMRLAPPSVLTCLSLNQASAWDNCEVLCRQWYGAAASPQSCVFSTLSLNNQNVDGTGEPYTLIFDANNPIAGSSWVTNSSQWGLVFDAQVVVGWSDEAQVLPAATTCGGAVHCVALRTSIFREPRN